MRERRLEVLPGPRVADPVPAATRECPLDQALAGPEAPLEAVDLAIAEDAAAGLATEAAAAVCDVAHFPHRLLEADDDIAALAFVQGREADPPALALGSVAPEPGGRGVAGARRVLAGGVDPDAGAEGAAAPPAPAYPHRPPLDPVAIEVEADFDRLARGVGPDRSDHRHLAHDLRLAAVEVADLDLHRRLRHGVDRAVLGAVLGGEGGGRSGEGGEGGGDLNQRDEASHRGRHCA